MIDLKNIARETDAYNFHSHTQFCDGRATMEEMLKSAIDEKINYYGFSPHSPIKCESTCNMSVECVKQYFDEFYRLKEIYADNIHAYVSMEIDYLNRDFGPHIDYFQNLNLDYRIGAVHFVENQDKIFIDCDGRYERFKLRLHDAFRNDIRYVVEKYFEQVLTMIELGGFDILAHFDKIAHNASLSQPGIENQHWYEALIDDVVRLAFDKKIIVEVNTKAYDEHKRIFPHNRWLYKIISSKLPIVVNSDAHYPDKINAGRKETIKIISGIRNEINTIAQSYE